MATDITTTNLKVNILSAGTYDDLTSKESGELYVVKENSSDIDSSIASRTYADVGRDAVVSSAETPTSDNTKIWIDTDEEVVYITPANADMDNLSEIGKDNIKECIAPKYNSATSIALSAGGSISLASAGWIYAYVGTGSTLSVRKDSSTGIRLITLVSTTGQQMTDNVYVPANTTIYIDMRSGTTELVYYPCKGI